MSVLPNHVWRASGRHVPGVMLAFGLCVLAGCAGVAQAAPVLSQIGQSRRILEGSTPLIMQVDPASVRESARAEAVAEGMDTSDNLLGDMAGARVWMFLHGITFDLHEVDELWGNVSGGLSRGPAYTGVTMPTLTVDMEKLVGLRGGTFNISALQIHGRSISQDRLSVFNPVSGFEADRSTRLFELWYQQSLLHGKLDVRVGQQDLDTEFMITSYGSLFLNANFGWPMAPSNNLYAGGPSWPLASPAVRLRYRPTDSLTALFVAADDNPPGNQSNSLPIQDGGNPADPTNQNTNNASGTRFNMGTGALLMAEVDYALSLPLGHGGRRGLPGQYKLGGLYDTARFPNYSYDRQGRPLGLYPQDAGNSVPGWLRGNWMVYGVVDQMVWRSATSPGRSLGVFARATGNGGDRNAIAFAVDAGLDLKAPFAGRDNDTLGLGGGMGRATYGQRRFDRNTHAIEQGNEALVELTYQAQVTPWCVLQPDFQYVIAPSGGIYAPGTHHRVGNEVVFGLHSSVSF